MNAQTDLNFVLRMRKEAADILRKHEEATSHASTAYRSTARQLEVFRESLQQTAKGMTTLTGAVRGTSAGIVDYPALMARAAANSGDPNRDPETARDVAPERIVRGTEQGEPILIRRSRALDQVDEADWEDERNIAPPGRRSPAAADRDSTGIRGDLHRQELYLGLREGRAMAAAFGLQDLTAISDLKAVVDAILRNQALLTRTHASASLEREDMDKSGAAIAYRPSEMPIDPRKREPGTLWPVPVVSGGNAASSVEFSPGYPARESLERSTVDAWSFAATIAAERREVMAEIRASLTSLSREMARAIAQTKERSELEDGRKSEEHVLERLTVELRRLMPTDREIEQAAADRGTLSREHRVPVVETVGLRRPSAMTVPDWIGSPSPEADAIGAHLRDVTAGWEAYGSGIARALGATDQALTGILTQTRDWRSAMHSLINSVVADFARIAIRQNVTGPLAEAMFGGGRNSSDAGLLGRAFGWITSLFAGGGVMTGHGPVPLRTYASGGIASSPQLALFGEGSTPEAYVPVPNGRIPVTLRGGGPDVGSIATNIVINVTGGRGGAADAVVGPDPTEQARNIGAMVSAAFNRNLAEQMRPGGLLNPSGYLGSGLVH